MKQNRYNHSNSTKVIAERMHTFSFHAPVLANAILSTDDVAKARVTLPQSGRAAGISMSRNIGAIRGKTPYTHHRQRHAGFRQPEQHHGGPARPGADAGLRSIREACPPEP